MCHVRRGGFEKATGQTSCVTGLQKAMLHSVFIPSFEPFSTTESGAGHLKSRAYRGESVELRRVTKHKGSQVGQ